MDIIILTICAVISGADGWEAIETFGKEKQNWLQQWLDLPNGIPKHDCIARVISRISTQEMSQCFANWAKSAVKIKEGEVISVDGKTARRSYSQNDKMDTIHMVSAWANQAGISLGQVKTDDKSNEITAIPELLKLLELKDCIVTTDAMGCQTEIAEKVIDKQGDYVLAVKGNQGLLHEAIIDYFAEAKKNDNAKTGQLQAFEEINAEHGRIETRRHYLSTCLDTLPTPKRWKGLSSIGMVESVREIKGTVSTEYRYYISSLTEVEAFARATRQHWGVENSLHWVLDVVFREDDSRIRKGYGAENFNVIRQIAINMLKQEASNLSLKRKRFKAALSDSFREKVIFSG